MNALLKIIITTVMGFLGSFTEVDHSQVNITPPHCKVIQFESFENFCKDDCRFNEIAFEMLKYNLDS